MVSYSGRVSRLRYSCSRAAVEYAAPVCQGLAGRVLDDLLAGQVLAALEPAALELSLAAADDLEQERRRLHQNWQQQEERARYQAERVGRQYDAAEPENRLVARELERRWEEALKEQRRLEEEYARFCRSQPQGLSVIEREQIRSLAQDVPALWQAATTTAADRQRIVPPAGRGSDRHGPGRQRAGGGTHPLGRGPAAATRSSARCSVTTRWPTTVVS